MTERKQPADHTGAHPRRALRPLLGIATLVPVILAGAAVALQESPRTEVLEPTTTQARPGAAAMYCPGPITVPEGSVAAKSDGEFAQTPPSTTAAIGTISVEPGSSLLHGRTTGSETMQDAKDGSAQAPTIRTLGAQDQVLSEQAAKKNLGAAVQQIPQAPSPTQVTSASFDGGTPVLDVTQATATTTGDHRALSTTRCTSPVTSADFLGASTQKGHSAILSLHNPTSRPATASVQVWSEKGAAAMEGRSRVVVAPGATEHVLLESIVPGAASLGVHLDVLGSPLVPTLQQTSRDGLTPGGAEILSSMAPPSTDLTIPAIHVTEGAPRLVLLNPAAEPVQVKAQVRGPQGPVQVPGTEAIEVPAGSVTAVPLPGLTPANYAVHLSAPSPVSAVVRFDVAGKDLPGDTVGVPVDTAVAAPAPLLTQGAVLAIPPGRSDGRLVLTASEAATAQIIPLRADGSAGSAVPVEIPAGSAVTRSQRALAIGPDTVGLMVVPSAGELSASWVQLQSDGAGANLVSVLTVEPPETLSLGVEVQLEN